MHPIQNKEDRSFFYRAMAAFVGFGIVATAVAYYFQH